MQVICKTWTNGSRVSVLKGPRVHRMVFLVPVIRLRTRLRGRLHHGRAPVVLLLEALLAKGAMGGVSGSLVAAMVVQANEEVFLTQSTQQSRSASAAIPPAGVRVGMVVKVDHHAGNLADWVHDGQPHPWIVSLSQSPSRSPGPRALARVETIR